MLKFKRLLSAKLHAKAIESLFHRYGILVNLQLG